MNKFPKKKKRTQGFYRKTVFFHRIGEITFVFYNGTEVKVAR